jgi:tubulin beta
LHFLVPSYAPFVAQQSVAYQGTSVSELTQAYVNGLLFLHLILNALICNSLFNKHNMLVACNPQFGKYLTAATIFRGNISSREAEHAVHQLQMKNSSSFCEWIPDNISVTLCGVPPVGLRQAAVCLANTVREWRRTGKGTLT